MTTEELYEMIEGRRLELGLSQMQLGQAAFGRDDNSAIQNLKRGSSPTLERLNAICDALGLEVWVGRPRALQGLSEAPSKTDFNAANTGRAGYLPIPWTRYGPGKGSSPVALMGSWLDANALNPEKLSAIHPDVSWVNGVDAAHTLCIIEAAAPRRGTGQYWCVEDGRKVLLARIAFLKDAYVVMSDDPVQAPRIIHPEDAAATSLLGRVACLAIITKG